MYFKQFYLGCLAQASYLVGDAGEAAVVDPRRDVDEYLEEAAKQGLAIRHVIETHLHADFVSGHRELAARTGARVYFGARAGATFPHVPAREGDEIRMGRVVLRFLETPGHTPESVSIVVTDLAAGDRPDAVLTGDTLFIGDVGRPDLLGARMSAAELAGLLYDSLHEKLLKLPDETKVFPAHGAGSLCGRNISSETSSTIGQQRRFNYALQPMPKEEFVRVMTADLPEAPAYFARDVAINREGAPELSGLEPPPALSPDDVARRLDEGAIALDTRPSAAYGTAHLPGSIHIGLSGQFASWAGALLSPDTPIVIVAEDPDRVSEARLRLTRVGLENVAGYLEGGVASWEASGRPLASTEQITVDELSARLAEDPGLSLLDVRRPMEWRSGHIAKAAHLPLNDLRNGAIPGEKSRPLAIICASGYRSSIASSLLEERGFRRTINVIGGMNAWTAGGLGTEASTP